MMKILHLSAGETIVTALGAGYNSSLGHMWPPGCEDRIALNAVVMVKCLD